MKRFIAIPLLFALLACDQLAQIASEYPMNTAPTQAEISAGLKEALRVGITQAVSSTNQTNGFYGNNLIKIPVPQEVEKIKSTLTQLGYTKPIDDFERSLNRAAEQASGQAIEIFSNAITKLTFTDVVEIWKGEDDAATQFLKRTSTDQLHAAFSPITKKAIEDVGVTKYWDDIANIYNNLPFVTPVNPNLNEYVNDQAINGLFTLVAQEEKKIREDPAARTTAILQRVFGYNQP